MQPKQFHFLPLHCAFIVFLLTATNNVTAQSGGATITLQPVPPKTVPPSDYPPGTTIVGQEIILGSVPARVWFEIHVTGFPTASAPNCLKTVQVRIDARDLDQEGGGYAGANADCGGSPAVGAGDLTNAVQVCTTPSSCRPTMSGLTGPCFAGEPDPCQVGRCSYVFQDQCDPAWICTGFACIVACDIDTQNSRCGATVNDAPSICMNDFSPSYLFTLVLDIPANAKGSYTIDFVENETFMQDGNTPPNNNIPIGAFNPAKITVPCGRCCYGVNTGSTGCVEGVSAVECATNAASAVFQANLDCPENGGPPCPLCALDEHCDDGLFCNGAEVCEMNGVCGPGKPPCDRGERCKERTKSCKKRRWWP